MDVAGEADAAVVAAGQAASAGARSLRDISADGLDAALRAIATHLLQRADAVIAANADDVRAAKAGGLADAFVDRLTLDASRVEAMADQLQTLADVPAEPARSYIRDLPDGLELHEWRRPVGVIGANFEARPNVVVDIASQLIKSRNAGVLRTGSSAIGSAAVLIDEVVGPAMAAAGLDPAAIQLLRVPGRDTAAALVRQPALIPLVILRGSGDSTRALAREAALHGVRTLAHADGGAVIYVDQSADIDLALRLIERSLDRLGVCNRLNLLLVQRASWDDVGASDHGCWRTSSASRSRCRRMRTRSAMSGRWTPGAEATITLAPAQDAQDAAEIANRETSGLAAADRGGRHSAPPASSWTPTRGRARSGMRHLACSTGSSCSRCPRPGSTSTWCRVRAAR